MTDLKNKVAYITGGSKGIGLGIAKKIDRPRYEGGNYQP